MEKYKFIISTDSGCDLSKEMCEQYGIIPIMMNYLDEDIIYKDTMEKSDIIAFYKQMEEGKVFKTSAININEAYEFLKELIKYNKPIIHISLGSGISGTYNNFLNAKEMIKEKYPESLIEIIDSTSASLGYGMMCIEAAKLRDEGKTYEEIVRYVENIKRGVNPYFETSTLTYLARGGRVTKIASIFGNVLSIRPVLRLDYDGHLVVYTKGHGKLNTFKKVIEAVKEAVIDPQNQTLYVSHSNAINDAVELAEKIKEEIGFKDIVYSYIGTIIGSHTGPGLVSIFFHGKDRFE
jgi:DegV family protein with EDD domain